MNWSIIKKLNSVNINPIQNYYYKNIKSMRFKRQLKTKANEAKKHAEWTFIFYSLRLQINTSV